MQDTQAECENQHLLPNIAQPQQSRSHHFLHRIRILTIRFHLIAGWIVDHHVDAKRNRSWQVSDSPMIRVVPPTV